MTVGLPAVAAGMAGCDSGGPDGGGRGEGQCYDSKEGGVTQGGGSAMIGVLHGERRHLHGWAEVKPSGGGRQPVAWWWCTARGKRNGLHPPAACAVALRAALVGYEEAGEAVAAETGEADVGVIDRRETAASSGGFSGGGVVKEDARGCSSGKARFVVLGHVKGRGRWGGGAAAVSNRGGGTVSCGEGGEPRGWAASSPVHQRWEGATRAAA